MKTPFLRIVGMGALTFFCLGGFGTARAQSALETFRGTLDTDRFEIVAGAEDSVAIRDGRLVVRNDAGPAGFLYHVFRPRSTASRPPLGDFVLWIDVDLSEQRGPVRWGVCRWLGTDGVALEIDPGERRTRVLATREGQGETAGPWTALPKAAKGIDRLGLEAGASVHHRFSGRGLVCLPWWNCWWSSPSSAFWPGFCCPRCRDPVKRPWPRFGKPRLFVEFHTQGRRCVTYPGRPGFHPAHGGRESGDTGLQTRRTGA